MDFPTAPLPHTASSEARWTWVKEMSGGFHPDYRMLAAARAFHDLGVDIADRFGVSTGLESIHRTGDQLETVVLFSAGRWQARTNVRFSTIAQLRTRVRHKILRFLRRHIADLG